MPAHVLPYIPATPHTHPQSPCICIPSMPTPRPPDQRGFAVGLHRQVRWQALSGAPIVTQVPSLRRRRGIGLPGVACPPGGGPLRLLRPGEQIPWERWGYEPRGAVTPIRRKPGKKLSGARKRVSTGCHSKIRVYVEHAIRRVKTWRIMSGVYRNPLKKYDRINDVVCGLVNQRLSVAGRTGSA